MQEKVDNQRPFEPEQFNANMMVQPDLFRIWARHQEHKWISTDRFKVTKNDETMRSPNATDRVNLDTLTQHSRNMAGTMDKSMMTSNLGEKDLDLLDDLNATITHHSKKYEPYAKIKLAGRDKSPKVPNL